MSLRRVGDVPDLTADPALAEKELGFKAPRVLTEMCRDQWNWQSCVPPLSCRSGGRTDVLSSNRKNPNGYASQ